MFRAVVVENAETCRCLVSRVIVEFQRRGCAVPRHSPSGGIECAHFLFVIECPISGTWLLIVSSNNESKMHCKPFSNDEMHW